MANRVGKRSRGIFAPIIAKMVTLSIAVGTASILVALMVMIGFQLEIKKKITSFVGDFEITKYSAIRNQYDPAPMKAGQISGLVANLPDVIEKIVAFSQKPMLIHTKVGVVGILCKGVDPIASYKSFDDYLIVGRVPHLTGDGYQHELLISDHLAQNLSIKLGDSVLVHTIVPTVRYRRLKIVGIYRTYLNEIDSNFAFCDMRLIQRLNNWAPETVTGYELFLKDGIATTKLLPEAILPLIDYNLRLTKTDRKYAFFYDWLAIIQKNTTVFMLFILLAAGFTMVATVLIQLMERSYMVGLLKALGAPIWKIYAIMLCNSFPTLFWGMVYGNGLGLGLCFLQYYYRCIRLEPKLYYMDYLPIYWGWQTIVGLNLLIFGFISIVLYCSMPLLRQKKIIEALQEG